jgi:hypothetical protein
LEGLDGLLDSLKNLNVQLPFRSPHPVVEPSDVLEELLGILTHLGIQLQDTEEIVPPLVLPPPDEFMNTLSLRIEEMNRIVEHRIQEHQKVNIRELILRDSLIETVRSFLVLLFLLSTQNYDLVTDEKEIWLVVPEG